MKLTEEMKSVIQSAQFISLITLNGDGTPHPIIVGGKSVAGDAVEIKIYKMETTQKNLAANSKMWVLAAAIGDSGPKGFQFEGSASVDAGKVVFTPESTTVLI